MTNAQQADRIRRMLATGMDPETVAANIGCTLRHVHNLSGNAPSAPPRPKQGAATVPAPRDPADKRTDGHSRPYRLSVAPAEPDHETRARLVRNIAADPVLMAWLHEHNARVIDNLADALLVEHGPAAAATALRAAQAHRNHQAPPWGKPGPEPADRRCGTTAGYQAHLRAGDRPCEPCSEASRVYQTNRRHPGRRHTDRQEQTA